MPSHRRFVVPRLTERGVLFASASESGELSHAACDEPAAGPVRHTCGARARVFSLEQCVAHAFLKLDWMASFPRLARGSAPTSHGTAPPTVNSCLWYRAVLCDSLIASRRIPMLREHFADALESVGWPDGACLFLSGRQTADTKARDDDRAVPQAVFFSPAAIAAVPHLIAVCGAEPSPPPDRACATLLVGEQSDWDLLPRGLH